MRPRCWARLGLVLLLGASVAAAEDQPVMVKWNPPKIIRHRFDPKRPPAKMPKLLPSESGVCHFEFTIDAGIGYLVDTKDPHTVEVEVDSVDIILDLPIDVWVANGAPPKLAQHEEGHRQICEDYYRNAATVARELGRKMIGRTATGTGRNKQEAQDKAEQQMLTELTTAYMQAVRGRCRICQDHCDAITVHGLKPVSEAEAIDRAEILERRGEIPPKKSQQFQRLVQIKQKCRRCRRGEGTPPTSATVLCSLRWSSLGSTRTIRFVVFCS